MRSGVKSGCVKSGRTMTNPAGGLVKFDETYDVAAPEPVQEV